LKSYILTVTIAGSLPTSDNGTLFVTSKSWHHQVADGGFFMDLNTTVFADGRLQIGCENHIKSTFLLDTQLFTELDIV